MSQSRLIVPDLLLLAIARNSRTNLIGVKQTYRVPLYSQTSASVEVQPLDNPTSDDVNRDLQG